MKLKIAILAAALIALAAPSVASAAVQDSVVGSTGAVGEDHTWPQMQINAQSGPSGENPTGTITYAGQTEQITCLRVQGNHALIGTREGAFGFPAEHQPEAVIQISDNGLSGDYINWYGPATCAAASFASGSGNTTGDFVVTDAQPPPPDADGDGVPNVIDACPNVSGPADNNGCPVPVDSDGDGVFDNADQCPNVPGSSEYGGCPPPPPAQPTSAADAKANWKSYGFKNQGQAVAWWNHNH